MKHLFQSKAALPASLMVVSALYGAVIPNLVAIIVFTVSAALAAYFSHLERKEGQELESLTKRILQLESQMNGIQLSRGLR